MGIISRHANAPYQDGEVLVAADLETDIQGLFTEFNGNIDTANLKDGAVTSTKLASGAIDASKIADGTASASEAVSADGPLSITTSQAALGAAITHVVGNPARHVIIHVSFEIRGIQGGELLNFWMMKDGVSILTNGCRAQNMRESSATLSVGRTFVDSAPTPGGTHVYQLKAQSTAFTLSAYNVVVIAFEPRR